VVELIPARPDLGAVRDAAKDCRACDLYKRGTQTVFGEGPRQAEVMLVGEQPGDAEDIAGHPFVGPAGKLLDRALDEAGIDRALVYVTNVVKHFKWEPRGKRRIHAKPNGSEIAACRPWLETEIALVKPRVVVCLGATAAQALLGKTARYLRTIGARAARDGDGSSLVDPARARRGQPPRRDAPVRERLEGCRRGAGQGSSMTESFRAALLLSMPQLQDPNFARTVVLLCDYGPEGAFGLVLNRPTEMPASEMVRLEPPVTGGNDMPLWIGGPVEPQRGWILLGEDPAADTASHAATSPGECKFIRDGLYLSTSLAILRDVLEASPAPRARVLAGYAGWGPGQLDDELAQSAWLLADIDLDIVFDMPAAAMWETAIRRLGADPSTLTMSHGVH
jgi:uracil-DNA glycosylase family protein